MKRTVRFLAVLLIICIFSGGGVGTIYWLLAGRIEHNRRTVKNKAVRFVLPGASRFDKETYAGNPADEDDDIIIGVDASEKLVGYAAIGTAKGYSSDIEVLVGVKPDLKKIIAVRILSQSETPGLGAKVDEVKSDKTLWDALAGVFSGGGAGEGPSVEEPWFQEQFKNKTLEQLEVVKVKNPERIQAITAATISSRAATKAVRNALQRVQKVVAGGTERGD